MTVEQQIAKVMRAAGRLVLNPTGDLAADQFPWGGTPLGHIRQCKVRPIGVNRTIPYEVTGRVGAVIKGTSRHVFSVLLRGWHDASVRLLFTNNQSLGADTGHRTLTVPQDHQPGKDATGRAVKLLLAPFDELHVPALMLYAAVPTWAGDSPMRFERREELGLPMAFECMRDSDGRILTIARLADITP